MKRVGKKSPAGAPYRDEKADADAFAREVADVLPLPRDPRGRVKERPPVTLPAAEKPRAGRPALLDESDDDFAAPGIDGAKSES